MTQASKHRSPASVGLTAGLLVALGMALGVLVANDSWLLPGLDDQGVRILVAASDMAEGRAPAIPVAPWNAETGFTELAPGEAAMPTVMARIIGFGVRPHVAGLWLLAAGLVMTVIATGWVAGGAGGAWGGALAALIVLVSPALVEVATLLGPTAPAMGLVALQLGVMVYQTRWNVLHGTLAAMAWTLSPVGVGAVVVAALWPALRPYRRRGPRGTAMLSALAPGLIVWIFGPWIPGLPSASAARPDGVFLEPLGALLHWAGTGVDGAVGLGLGVVALGVVTAAMIMDGHGTPQPPEETRWQDPRSRDVLAERARVAAPALAGGVAVASLFFQAGPGWTVAIPPLAVLAGVSIARAGRALGSFGSWVSSVVAAVWLVAAAWTTVDTVRWTQEVGRAHTARRWVASEVIRWLDNRAPPGVRVYADEPYLIHIQTTRRVRDLTGVEDDLGGFARTFHDARGAVVLTGEDRSLGPRLAELLGLTVVVETPEGVVMVPGGERRGPPGGVPPEDMPDLDGDSTGGAERAS